MVPATLVPATYPASKAIGATGFPTSGSIDHTICFPIISHTGARALNDNPRNVWDSEMKACADKGGVVGVYWMPFLVANSRPTGADLVAHMTHVRNVCGEDHVAIGTGGDINKTVIDDKARAAQRTFFEDRSKRGIAAPG